MEEAYTLFRIRTSSHLRYSDSSILIIYTGGTIGMSIDFKTNALVPFNFGRIMEKIPEINQFEFKITVLSMKKLIDSSDITPEYWIYLAELIMHFYKNYTGFIILHGTDTMAYTASALSFLLLNLHKPIILTGSQLPIGIPRTDARENLISALELAAARKNNHSIINEVCIYFNRLLLRGNRSKKIRSVDFTAFTSENYPYLAKIGTYIQYNMPYIATSSSRELKIYSKISHQVHLIKLFPGIHTKYIAALCYSSSLRGIILETYGSGNAHSNQEFLSLVKKIIQKGIIVLNISQSLGGRVDQTYYPNGKQLEELGVISGSDMTAEAAITKMMVLLGNFSDPEKIMSLLKTPMSGEMNTESV